MWVVVWKDFSTSVGGGVHKFVKCENCGQDYVYGMYREAIGSAASLYMIDQKGNARLAQKRAEKALNRILETDCELVPCIKCGWYQANMRAKLRRDRGRWASYPSRVGLLGGIVLGVCGFVEGRIALGETPTTVAMCLFGAAAFCVIVSGAIFLAGKFSGWRIDPNRLPLEKRLVIAANLAITLETYESHPEPENAFDFGDAIDRQ
jgi:hypothetical protein